MALPTVASLSNDPSIAVALAASQYLASDSFDNYRFSEPPTLEYTNLPTRLIGLCATPEILRNLLNALVAVSASTSPTGNESIACALRLDPDHPTQPAVELILSSHEPVRKGTVRFLQEIWKQMLAISAVPNKRSGERDSFLRMMMAFRHTVYIHTLRKLRRDFAIHMAVIDHWKAQNVADNGELLVEFGCGDDARLREPLVETLFYLERCRNAFAKMREDGQEPKRLILTRGDFLDLVAAMELGSQAADKLLMHTISLRILSMRCFDSKRVLWDTFQCITSLPRHIVELLQFAANHMESLHTHTLLLTLVSPVATTPQTPWPQTKQIWERIREHILKDKDCKASPRISHDLLDVPTSSDNLVVHGELTLITYLHALHFHAINTIAPPSSLSFASPNPAHLAPFNYIATTSPPCAPSALWIDAYNARHMFRGDGLRFDIALAPFVHWGTTGIRNHGWRWIPLPPIPADSVNGVVEDTSGAASTSTTPPVMCLFGHGTREAEGKIVAAAWDAFAKMAGEQPVSVKPIEKAGRRRSSVLGSQKAWKGRIVQKR